MTNTRHHTDVVIAVTLPRPAREVAARLTSRLASKGNGMSAHAQAAVEALLTPNDRVELTYLQAVAVMSQAYAESARIELARSRGKMSPRQQQVDQVIGWLAEQTRDQMIATPVDVEGVQVGQIRTGLPGRHRAPQKLDTFPRN